MPSTGGESDIPAAPHSKKPRGHYTARLLTRLPIARFRRFFINRSNRDWLHPDVTILGRDGSPGQVRGVEGVAMPECGR